ncbi:CBS domain-containing protein [Gordonia rhizosphera]|uniref:CBS domain-containing protein n=1 Tax=Gordonia rhizosphera NBRC 16068 TaxID=1108045 RepID=K6WAD3_9ACTN|nr:CBS domain-containing protein [Gordonia rhizosphera]GAB89162.1 hypothetical protein GORHZ_053_00150 [Gordonia rhizosphera NBRC 16068]
MPHRTVADVMTADVLCLSLGTSFRSVVEALAERGVSGAPVVDTDGRVVGVVSEADLITAQAQIPPDGWHRFLARVGHSTQETPHGAELDTVMHSPAITIPPDATVREAATQLARHDIKRLPVVDDDGRPIGIVSRKDVLRVYLRSDSDLADDIRTNVLERAMWMDPASIEVQVADGTVTFRGTVERQSMVPIIDHLTRAVDGVVDVVVELDARLDDRHVPPPPPEVTGILHLPHRPDR